MKPGATALPVASISMRPLQAARWADVDDAVVVDRDLARVRLAAAAVVDRAATNDDVVPGGRHARAGSAEAQCQRQRACRTQQTAP